MKTRTTCSSGNCPNLQMREQHSFSNYPTTLQRARAGRKRPNPLLQMCPCTYHMAALNSQSHNGVIWSRTVRIMNDFCSIFNIKMNICAQGSTFLLSVNFCLSTFVDHSASKSHKRRNLHQQAGILNEGSCNGVIWSRTVRIMNDFCSIFNIKMNICAQGSTFLLSVNFCLSTFVDHSASKSHKRRNLHQQAGILNEGSCSTISN